jgi:hypothetical protein
MDLLSAGGSDFAVSCATLNGASATVPKSTAAASVKLRNLMKNTPLRAWSWVFPEL